MLKIHHLRRSKVAFRSVQSLPVSSTAQRVRDRSRRSSSSGFSLLEVILAGTIFLGATVALSQLVWNGSRASIQSRLLAEATWRCESKMQEAIARVVPLSSTSATPFEDDPSWLWSLNVSEGPYAELLVVDVSVTRDGSSPLASANFRLRRWMRDPQWFIDAAAEEAAAAAAETSSSSTQSSSPSSSSSNATSGSSSSSGSGSSSGTGSRSGGGSR